MAENDTKRRIWVLIDNKIGNANQAIALAQSLGEEFELKNIEYNGFGNLPNYFLGMFPIHVKKSILKELKHDKSEKIIISAGRRTAALAAYLKKISNTENPVKIIQIMRPGIDPREFDLIILPQHDSFNYTLPNVVRIIGALTNVQHKMKNLIPEFEKNYPEIDKFIAVIIGGSTKSFKLKLEDAQIFAQTLSNIAAYHSLKLFITFSRRTPDNVKTYFKQTFSDYNVIYDPLTSGNNPYPAILARADYVLCTADSISMCSEAVSTGTPVYIFCPGNFKLKKHNFFIQQLVDLGLSRRINTQTAKLEKYDYVPLNEINKAVSIIKTRIL